MKQENLPKVLSQGHELVTELREMLTMLRKKKLDHGYWDLIKDTSGCLPESRKGASMNLVANEIYVFGGFSRETFNDLKVFNISQHHWR